MWFSCCSVALWFLIILVLLALFFLLRLHRSVQWMMGRAVLFQIHCTSSMPSAGRPLPPLSRACQTPPQWCEPDPCSDLMTFHLSFHLYYTSPRRHEDVSVWSVYFCLIKGISRTVSCGDLIKNCILFLAIFASFINSHSKESRLDRKNDASLIQTCTPPTKPPPPPCNHCIRTMTLTATAFTTYKYLHPLRHSLLFYFVLLVQAQIFSFWMTDWSLLALLARCLRGAWRYLRV